MKYLAVLGRQPEISLAELKSLFFDVKKISSALAVFESNTQPDISRLGGTLKLAKKIETTPLEYLKSLPEGKITLGFSDYSKNASKETATLEALKLKKILKRQNRPVRVLENRDAILSTAASHHNQLAEKKNHVEILKHNKDYYVVIGVQNITAYKNRDQLRPARDAKVGMLPPKLAQILINLCGPLRPGSIILDPFCGTGVLLQEALLMGFTPYGTDLSERMVDYSRRNLDWISKKLLTNQDTYAKIELCVGDAIDFEWQKKIDAVACETYLGPPMSTIPPEIKLKTA